MIRGGFLSVYIFDNRVRQFSPETEMPRWHEFICFLIIFVHKFCFVAVGRTRYFVAKNIYWPRVNDLQFNLGSLTRNDQYSIILHFFTYTIRYLFNTVSFVLHFRFTLSKRTVLLFVSIRALGFRAGMTVFFNVTWLHWHLQITATGRKDFLSSLQKTVKILWYFQSRGWNLSMTTYNNF